MMKCHLHATLQYEGVEGVTEHGDTRGSRVDRRRPV